MVRFACPHCGMPLIVDSGLAGQEHVCARCGQLTTVPNAPPIAEPPEVASPSGDEPLELGATSPVRRPAVSTTATCLIIVVLALLSPFVFYYGLKIAICLIAYLLARFSPGL